MQVDHKDTELLEKCADMIHELYNYIMSINSAHHKRVRVDEKISALKADIQSATKLMKRRK
jgi:hypothetical protein